LSSILKSKEPTLQVALDALKLTPFYNAFEISADVPEIYMQEFWVTVSRHHSSLRFKLNGKSHTVNIDNFRDMLKICPKLPGQIFEEPPLEEEILSFIRDLGHTGEIKFLSDVNVNHMHQPWRSFAAIINKCLSGKTTALESLRLSRAQILWGNVYGAILPQYLTNQDMLESKAYKTYQAYATGEKTPKPKSIKKKADSESSPKTKLTQASKGKRIKTIAKGDKPAKKKQSVTKIKSDLGADEGTDDDADNQDDENLDDANQDDDDEQTDSDNDGGNFIYPKFSTHDEEDKEEDSFDPRVQTPSHVESTDDEDSDEEIQDANVEGDKINEEETNEEAEVDALYRDVNVNLEGRDTEIIDAPRTIFKLLNPDTGIDSLFNLNNESTSLVDVPVTTFAKPPLLSATTLPPPPTPLITHLQQTPVPTLPTVLSSSLQDLPNFGSLFGLRDEAQAENADFLNKLDDNIKKIIKDQVKEQVKAQVSKILPKIEKTVNEQLEAEVLTRSSNESKTSHAVAANLSELELKKILIDKMESNKSIHRSDEQKNLYKALVDAYKSDKLILDTYGDTVSFKRCRDDEDKDEEPSAGSNQGSKRRRAGKEPESTSAPKEKTSKTSGKSYEGSKSKHKTAGESAQTEEPMHTTKDLEEPAHQEFKTGVTEDQPNEETPQFPDWFQRPTKLPSPDRDWNKTLPDAHGPVQPWLSSLAQKEDPRESFNELMDTPLDFSAFVMNRLKVDTLTPELLTGPTFELMKGSCKSLVELEYLFEEVYKATTEQLDWNNPEGQQYPHDLRKPLPLIPNSRGRRVIPFDHFINNDLEYLSGGVSSRKYATSVTKTKAADYEHIKWIEDLVPNRMWSQVPVIYDKHKLWGISHWGRKRQKFYGFAANRESARDVYSKRGIIAVTKLEIVDWHNYKHLDWITVRRDDDKLYKFKEDDFNRLRIQDIEDMLLLLVQGNLTNLTVKERLAFSVSLRMFTRSFVIQRRVEDL
ncbi:hypothetical protein Tco_0641004, partial [Tanacetum coccineum]